MLIAGTANQVVVNAANSSDKGKSDGINNNVSFLSTVKEVAENLAGKIVVAGGADIAEPDFLRQKFGYEIEIPEKIETVYDFIAEIRNILKDKKKR